MKCKTVLFVDDDTRVLAALKRGLAEEPYEKLFASGGHEALDVLQGHGVQVMVSDVSMPDMSGLKLLQIVRRTYPEVLCVLLSGQPQLDQAVASALVRGVHAREVFAFIAKPWDIEGKLKETIRQALLAQQQSVRTGGAEVSLDQTDGAASVCKSAVGDPGQSRCPCEAANVSNAPVETHPMQTGEWER